MLKFVAILAFAAMCTAQKSSDFIKFESEGSLISQTQEDYDRTRLPEQAWKPLPESTWTSEMYTSGNLEIREPLPVEVAQSGMTSEYGKLPSETMEYPAPALSVHAPLVNLPKGGQEVVDIPHANIRLPGNSIQNKDLHLNLPSPVVEAPKPIVENKDVLFRLPQPVFYVPRPVIQHKPIVYKVGHTLRPLLTKVNTRPYLFKVPQVRLSGKSSYTQAIPREY